jgi:hypothetical protein
MSETQAEKTRRLNSMEILHDSVKKLVKTLHE